MIDKTILNKIYLYTKVFYYNEIDSIIGRRNPLNLKIIEDELYYKVSMKSFEGMVPKSFIQSSEKEQCNMLTTQLSLIHRLQKNS